MDLAIFRDNYLFQSWSGEHLLVVLISIVVGILLIRLGRRSSPEMAKRIGDGIAISISGTLILWTLAEAALGRFDVKEDLPYVICNFMALVIPALMLTKNRFLFQVFYYWILAITIQAILTPHLEHSFPHYTFIKFWVVHSGIVIAILYATLVYKMRPTLRGLFASFVVLQLYMLVMYGINAAIDTNHMYLNHKPPTKSVLDLFGPWPQYIFVSEAIGLIMFFIVYLPFAFKKRNKLSVGVV